MQIDELIEAVRKRRVLSIETLAARLRESGVECTTASVYNWQSGRTRPNPNTKRLLVEALERMLSGEA